MKKKRLKSQQGKKIPKQNLTTNKKEQQFLVLCRHDNNETM